jgi:hypothetical protein
MYSVNLIVLGETESFVEYKADEVDRVGFSWTMDLLE